MQNLSTERQSLWPTINTLLKTIYYFVCTFRWQDAAMAYLSESWRRHVMWYVKEDAKLGFLDTDKPYRINQTFERTAVSRKLLAFQVLFLDIAMPKDKTRKDLIKRYDANLGFPTAEMVKVMKDSIEKLKNVKTYKDWFDVSSSNINLLWQGMIVDIRN